jgi:hypothetical protein
MGIEMRQFRLGARSTWRVVLGIGVLGGLMPALAQEPKVKKPEWSHAMDLRVRKAGETGFDKALKYGVEAFFDPNSNKLVYISDVGSAVATAGAKAPEGKAKDPEWSHSMDLKVRKAGENDFNKALKFGFEVFFDPNAGKLIYANELGNVAVAAGNKAPEKSKDPEWSHAMEVKVRKQGETGFEKAPKISIEVFYDPNTNHLIYLSETGSFAVVPGNKPADVKGKGPVWKTGYELRVRKGDEPDFNKDTKKYGLEVFVDEATGKALLVSEVGTIAVLNGPAGEFKTTNPTWLYGLNLKARKAGEASFDKARPFGLEIFKEENTGALIYITETGAMTFLPK